MGKQWGITAFLASPAECAAALAAAIAGKTGAPPGFSGQGGAERWQAALRELEECRLAAEPRGLSEPAQEALLALLTQHARSPGQLDCTDAERQPFSAFIANWLGWFADPGANPRCILPGSFLGWRGSDASPIGSIPPALIQALPAPRAQQLAERLRSPWGPQVLALLGAIRAAAKPEEHAVLLPWVEDDDDATAAPPPADLGSAKTHYTRTISWLLNHAVASGASDLLITGGVPPQLVVDGRLEAIPGPVVPPESVMRIAEPVLDEAQRSCVERCGLIRMSFGLAQVGRMRLTMTRQRRCYLIHIRFLPTQADHWGLDGSGYVAEATPRPGLVLVAGASGTGRSTTAHAIIDAHNRGGSWRICTIEEPIEGVHPNHRSLVTQHGVGESEDVQTFALAVEAVLEGGPQVVLIDHVDSQVRLEAACLLVRAGALVVSTMCGADAEAALAALHRSVPPAVALVQAVIESRWARAPGGIRRLERSTLLGPALAGLRARFDALAGHLTAR